MKRILAMMTAAVMALALVLPAQAAESSIYVAPDGSDTNIGSLESPFATLERAKEAATAGTTVYFRGGEYQINQTVTFTAADSNVTYKAYENEKPVFQAGTKITGWTQIDNGLWKAQVPKGTLFRNLYVGGQKAVRGRYPNAGEYLLIPADPTNEAIPIEKGVVEKIAGYQDQVELRMNIEWMNKVLRISEIRDAGENAGAIINPVEWKALTTGPQGAKMSKGRQYWLENALEFVDESGEWYLDSANGVVYYKPYLYESMETAEAIAGNLETIIKLDGTAAAPVTGLTFEGISFTGTGWTRPSKAGLVDVQANSLIPEDMDAAKDEQYRHGLKKDKMPGAIYGNYATDLTIQGCSFYHLGASGIVMDVGGENISIIGNAVYDTSGNGIEVGSDYYRAKDAAMYPQNVKIDNNYVENVANDYYGGVGILVFYADGLAVEHNQVKNVPYSGISVGWGWSTSEAVSQCRNFSIKYNRVEDFTTILRDSGGIYTPNPVGGTNVIEGNYVIGNAGAFLPTSGTVAIYHDGASANWTDSNNVIEMFGKYLISVQSISGQECNDITIQNNYSAPNPIGNFSDSALAGRNIVTKENQHFKKPTWPEEAQKIIENAGIQEEYRSIIPQKELDAELHEFYKKVDLDDSDMLQVQLHNGGSEKTVQISLELPDGITAQYSQEVTLAAGEEKTVSIQLETAKDCPVNYYMIPLRFLWDNGHRLEKLVGIAVEDSSALFIDINQEGYEEHGDFAASGLPGYSGSSRYGYSQGAWARWTPELPADGAYKVSIFVLNHPTSDTAAKVDVVYDGGTETKIIDYSTNQGGWVELGTFPFQKGKAGYVQNTKSGNEKETGFIRTSAVSFVRVIPDEEREQIKKENAVLKLGDAVVLRTDKNYFYRNGTKESLSAAPVLRDGHGALTAEDLAKAIGGKAAMVGEELRIYKGTVGARFWSGSQDFELNRVPGVLPFVPEFQDVSGLMPAQPLLEHFGYAQYTREDGLILFVKGLILDPEQDRYLYDCAYEAFVD